MHSISGNTLYWESLYIPFFYLNYQPPPMNYWLDCNLCCSIQMQKGGMPANEYQNRTFSKLPTLCYQIFPFTMVPITVRIWTCFDWFFKTIWDWTWGRVTRWYLVLSGMWTELIRPRNKIVGNWLTTSVRRKYYKQYLSKILATDKKSILVKAILSHG